MHVTSTVQLVYNQSEIEQKPHFGGVFCFLGLSVHVLCISRHVKDKKENK
jgi:hypothetical protein